MNNGLSISSSLVPTNQDITVTFTPLEDVSYYKYRIFKNSSETLTNTSGELVSADSIYNDYITINTNRPVDINLTETGVFKLEIVTIDYNGNMQQITSDYYVIDKEAPKITLKDYKNKIFEYKIGETNLVPNDLIKVTDNYNGDMNNSVVSNFNELKLNKEGIEKLNYQVVDSAGNLSEYSLNIHVLKSNINTVHTFQIIISILAILFVIGTLIYNRTMNLEKRLSKYSVEPIKKYSFSLFDKVYSLYRKIIDYLKNIVSKSVFITRHSVKFDKYVGIVDNFHRDSIELICSKIVVAIVTLILAIFIKTIRFKTLALEEYFIPLIIGYLSLDIYFVIKYRRYRNRLENDLLQAIIVMNNAFKSGRSITQAIELVTRELEGPIALEFNILSMQLKFGISIDVAFSNFAERIKIEEVNYLTASLSILNKTGGNIIKVFSSIEKTLFNKKKLGLELKSLTGSSRIIMYLLTALPIFLVVVISIVNPNYFLILYTTPLGFIILGIALIIYISYIIVVRKIMKVRM